MIVCAFLVGIGLGFVDGAMNVYFAAHHGPRLMNWLHACFGIGAALAPIIVNYILRSGGDWRSGYFAILVLYAVLLVAFWWTRRQWVITPASASAPVTTAAARQTLRLWVVWLGILLFCAYAGVELVPSDWAPSLLETERGFARADAADLVSSYWFFFTVGRIAFGFIVTYISQHLLVRVCLFATLAGAVLMALGTAGNQLSQIGLIVAAFAMSPLFALLVTATQERLGARHAPNAIGFQVAAASVGAGLIPALTGVIAQRTTLEAVAVIWVALCVVCIILYELSQRLRVRAL
jgi:fucose permease